MSFNPDVRNLGGRKILVDQIYNHYMSLSKIKSTLNTLEVRPALVKKVSPSESKVVIKNVSDQKNIVAMKTRVQSAKKQIDTNEPVSFNQIRKGQPCGASSKQFQFIMGEHFKNLISQKSRIRSQNSMSERKKNFYDTTAYPAKFFRRVDDSSNSSSVISTNSKQHRKGVKSAQLTKRNQDDVVVSQNGENNRTENNYYYNSSSLWTAMKKQQKEENILVSSIKKGNHKNNYSLNSSSTKQLANSTQPGTLTSQLLRASPTSSSKQYSQLLNHSITNTLQRLSPNASGNINAQQQQQLFIKIKQKQKQQFRLLDDRKQFSLTQEQEEQRWSKIVQEIPVLLDINENSINLLKEHLVNLIVEFRLYRGGDYEAMKNIFDKKNPQINEQLSAEIFQEIVNALNE